MAISHGLTYEPKLYDMGTSKIGNKKIEKAVTIGNSKNFFEQKT